MVNNPEGCPNDNDILTYCKTYFETLPTNYFEAFAVPELFWHI